MSEMSDCQLLCWRFFIDTNAQLDLRGQAVTQKIGVVEVEAPTGLAVYEVKELHFLGVKFLPQSPSHNPIYKW